jgi:hypothetical protein
MPPRRDRRARQVSRPMPWPRTDLLDLLGIEHPIIQAPTSTLPP